MADPQPFEDAPEDGRWNGVESATDDPEELRVIFCAMDSFLQYGKAAHFNCTHLRRQSFYALPQAHWKMLADPPFSYLDTLDKVDEAIDSNADLARAIVKFGLPDFVGPRPPGRELSMPDEWVGAAKQNDIDKARSTVRQFYRDWSAEGAREREVCYGPVMRALEDERRARTLLSSSSPPSSPSHSGGGGGEEKPRLSVLVPGAGLGRLVFDLCRAGFDVEGNEISYHQLLASSYVLNGTARAGQHTVHPWVHTFSNHVSRANHLRGYAVPDVHPGRELEAQVASGQGVGTMAMCAADFLCLYGDAAHAAAYDAVASVFFLDTAPNLVRYLATVYHCLRPGGLLVNVGPLLWHFENNAPGNHGHGDDGDGEHDPGSSSGIADPGSFELSDDEVRALVARVGFAVERWETGIEAPYIQDADSMLQTTYRASSWVARKPEAGPAEAQIGDEYQ
ncbi:uncharacterized protein E0L32_009819 [Thyridium curvatum]|uniref:carnosine N-methyltransferase n=1 Tax=Thyridium curvatum TaxID=1093900 RepID=A0A507AN85_9PEZI|nr:uncharacterized protein E0L32_009819 [Thyridium curvatum]TPX08757.1 hypothetical protein E0L32_009819 [Thyridium curvatum]